MSTRQAHWNQVYTSKAPTEVSWYQPRPERSLALIRASGVGRGQPIIDVGAGASLLVDALLADGYQDVTVLDISEQVLSKVRERLGSAAVQLLQQDVTSFVPQRRYALWHDRAVFHFLTDSQERAAYVRALHQGVKPNGHVLIATFAPTGPERCSGLPVVRYDAPALAAQLGDEFELLESAEEQHRTPWGAPQQFIYAHFQRIGPEKGLSGATLS
jgi:2-polyprenyl-3-methyl-5-hydroxy-6-metoxy-1,4-benzoquinol methylase